jgi:hypothetical protein
MLKLETEKEYLNRRIREVNAMIFDTEDKIKLMCECKDLELNRFFPRYKNLELIDSDLKYYRLLKENLMELREIYNKQF